MNKERLAYLLGLLTTERLSSAEQAELKAFVSSETNRKLFLEVAQNIIDATGDEEVYDEDKWLPFIYSISRIDDSGAAGKGSLAITKRMNFFLSSWFHYSAAILLLVICVVAYFWPGRTARDPEAGREQPFAMSVPADVAPGGNRAVLTLSDGSVISLDSAANGKLADQGGTEVRKLSNGQIEYKKKSGHPGEVLYNTMSTPRGGQFQIRLPDGTEVWLNAASSITYPTVFSGKERKVMVTGEVYFEVARNERIPFRVSTKQADIEVLGTHFNVNAYPDESLSRTTLLEGSIKLRSGNQEVMIRPGEQAQLPVNGGGGIHVAGGVDLSQVMAWQRGLFEFNQTSLPDIMRVVSRWYDVDIIYATKPAGKKFGGGISRKLPLSNLLKMLEANGVHFELEGKTLKVVE